MNSIININEVNKGGIVWCNLGEKLHVRPCVVMLDKDNKKILIPLTTKTELNLPTRVKVNHECLKKECISIVEQSIKIENAEIVSYLGELDEETIKRIDDKLKWINVLTSK